MATFNRPSILPTWCENNQDNVAQPPDSLRAAGYTANEVMMAEHYNWQMWELGNWLGYLDQANASTVMSTTLDVNTRLVNGGAFTFSATNATLTWDATAYLSIPSIPLTDNTIAAGSVALGPNQIAYVQANVPYTTTGGITSGDAHVTGIATTSPLAVGQSVSGSGIPANTTITAINDSTLTLSAAATATNATATLTFAGSGPLTVQSADAASFLPNANTVIIALGVLDSTGNSESAVVGANTGQMVVRDNETKRLLGTGYVSTLRATAGQAITRNQALYISQGDNGRVVGNVFPCDVSGTYGASRGQFIGFAISSYNAADTAHIVTAGIVNGFSGLSIGSIYYLDPANPGNVTKTAPTAVGQYIVPVGCAITASSMRINPSATHALAAITNGQTVNGPLSVNGQETIKPGQSGNALTIYDAAGKNTVASVDDTGGAFFAGSMTTPQSSISGTLTVGNLYGALGTQVPYINLQTNLIGTSGVSIRTPFVTATSQMNSLGIFTAANGIKRDISLGAYGSSAFPGGNQFFTTSVSGTETKRRAPITFQGNMLAIAVTVDQALPTGTAVNVLILKNDVNFVSVNLTSINANSYLSQFSKGSYAVSAGDTLTATVNFSKTNISVSAQCTVTLESDA